MPGPCPLQSIGTILLMLRYRCRCLKKKNKNLGDVSTTCQPSNDECLITDAPNDECLRAEVTISSCYLVVEMTGIRVDWGRLS